MMTSLPNARLRALLERKVRRDCLCLTLRGGSLLSPLPWEALLDGDLLSAEAAERKGIGSA